MNDYETKMNILEGISKQTGLTLRLCSKTRNNPIMRICLESEKDNFWEYSQPFQIDCRMVFFINEVGKLLASYLKYMKGNTNEVHT